MKDKKRIQSVDDLVEELAAVEHQRWSHWQSYLHSKCERRDDGSLVIPASLASKWEHQIRTPYSELSETEKDSDREQVRAYLPLLKRAFQAKLQFE